jgi:hypothetical protein
MKIIQCKKKKKERKKKEITLLTFEHHEQQSDSSACSSGVQNWKNYIKHVQTNDLLGNGKPVRTT